MAHDLHRSAAAALVDFYAEAGVDCALDERPHDRFAEAETAPGRTTPLRRDSRSGRDVGASAATAAPPPPRALPKAAAGAPDEAASAARELVRLAPSLEKLQAMLAAFDGCALKLSARNLVYSDGNPEGRLMMVGEAPGAEEDRIGKPFVGRSGQLLDRMLAAIGLDRNGVYIANVVPWRPPGNRTPTPQEITICRPFIDRQIELAEPEILVCLGAAAAQTLLNMTDGILKNRGRWTTYRTAGGREIRALATLHPAYLLREPSQKRLAWRDFLALRRALDGKA